MKRTVTIDSIDHLGKVMMRDSLSKQVSYFHDCIIDINSIYTRMDRMEKKNGGHWMIAGPFIRVIRPTGTYMIDLYSLDELPGPGETVPYPFGTADREHTMVGIMSAFDSIVNYVGIDRVDEYESEYFDGRSMRYVTFAQARDIAKDEMLTMLEKARAKK